MATTVTITGTGTPIARPGLAGPGVLVRHRSTALQFDCGRSTVTRLVEAGLALADLSAMFLTHHHSDHVVGLADLVMTRWLEDISGDGGPPLAVFAPDGEAAELAERILAPWEREIRLRARHSGRTTHPAPNVHRFPATTTPTAVFTGDSVEVSAVAVHHEPVVPAVGYRIVTPDGAVVVSGDTRVCREIEDLAAGASVLVHEAFRLEGTQGLLRDPEALAAYHADTIELGALAARADVDTLVLTHLIPPLDAPGDETGFSMDIVRGGFTGTVLVASDLTTVELS